MYPLHMSLTGFAIIGLTLLILSLTILYYLLRLPVKSRASWLLAAFFAGIALSGAATILTNGISFWDRLFKPWQDFWVLVSGAALSQFAYAVPDNDRPGEARFVLFLTSGLALLALGYSVIFDYRFVFHWTPGLDVQDAFYLLLPLSTLLVVAAFLRRSAHFSALTQAAANAGPAGRTPVWWRLLHPQGKDAQALRRFALALSLAFLPGLGILLDFLGPIQFILQNVGSLLAVAAIAVVYFNYAPEMSSFMGKLVGLTLVTVLLIFSVTATVEYRRLEMDYKGEQLAALIAARGSLLADSPATILAPIAYVVTWDAQAPSGSAAYHQRFTGPEYTDFNLDKLIAENRQGYLDTWLQPVGGELASQTGQSWQFMPRYGTYPVGSAQPDYQAFLFTEDNMVYEIGLSQRAEDDFLTSVAIRWMALITVSSMFVLLVFPLFFRRTLVDPLMSLLEGMRRVNDGDLETAVSIRYHDEIGSLTGSFNTLTSTLKHSYDVLEQRVADRTRELSAFSDLTMLSSGENGLSNTLQLALDRILEVGRCQALCLHLLAEDNLALHLAAYRNIPESAVVTLQKISLTSPFAARMQQLDRPLISNNLPEEPGLPPELIIPGFNTYLGSPLSTGERTHGWLSCYQEDSAGFGVSEASLLVALARQLGVIVENQRLRQRIGQVAAYEERQRLARDLHDSVTQLLFSMTLFSRAAKDAMAEDDGVRLEGILDELGNSSIQALREVRSLLFELQPPSVEELGLARALTRRFDMVERRVGVRVVAHFEALPDVPPQVERDLYFVAIEALNNVLKHAGADEVSMVLARNNDHIQMILTDNGRGFDQSTASNEGGLGLQNMRQRVNQLGGVLEIETKVGEGVRIVATIPCTW